MTKRRPTQRERIIAYMKARGSITRLDSCTELFIFELSSRIGELEKRGWVFDKSRETYKNGWGESKTFTIYRILKEGETV